MKIFITGGCGYVGTVLTNELLKDNHEITVLDTQWFGNFLEPNNKLKIIKGNIQDLSKISFKGFNCIIHLANIANDPGVELNETLSWEVNVLASQQLAEKAIEDGVDQIIYASSGSVYGVKEEKEVTEDLSLVPISAYNKTKMVSERVLFSYKDYIKVYCIRPATVCGYSPRMRLDVSVNLLTMQALTKQKINVFGGNQTRPNINIHDMVGVYKHFLKKKIECRPVISGNIAQQLFWKKNNKKTNLPNADIIHKYGIYLPNHANQTVEDTKYICKEFKKVAQIKLV